MTKIWAAEEYYPEIKTALFDEKKSKMTRLECFELKAAKRFTGSNFLHFNIPKKGLVKIQEYGVIDSDILIPLVNSIVREAIEKLVSSEDIQFVPVIFNFSKTTIGSYFLLNPLKIVDVIDHEKSEPIMIKIPGAPDVKVGFKKMILNSNFPANGIGRQKELLSYIAVGDQLAIAISEATKRGVRFISGRPLSD
jgi:hypothetical protein